MSEQPGEPTSLRHDLGVFWGSSQEPAVRTSFHNVEFGRHTCTPKGSVHAHRIGQQ